MVVVVPLVAHVAAVLDIVAPLVDGVCGEGVAAAVAVRESLVEAMRVCAVAAPTYQWGNGIVGRILCLGCGLVAVPAVAVGSAGPLPQRTGEIGLVAQQVRDNGPREGQKWLDAVWSLSVVLPAGLLAALVVLRPNVAHLVAAELALHQVVSDVVLV